MTIPPRLSDSDSNFWFEKFLPVVVLAQSCTSLGTLLIASYSDSRPTEHVSFYVEDRWCEASREGIGAHCFSDFYFPKRLMAEESILENSIGIPHPYFPSTTLFHRLFEVFAGQRTGLFVFLFTLAVAGLVPPLVASRGRGLKDKTFAVLGLGILSLPFLISIDRGNSVLVGACFACVSLWFGQHRKSRGFEAFVLLSSLIRPHYLFLVLLTPREKILIGLTRVVGVFVVFQSTMFALSPGYSIRDWWTIFKVFASYSESSPVDRPYVVNLYFGRSLFRVSEVLGVGQRVALYFSDSLWPSWLVVTVGLTVVAIVIKLRLKHFKLAVILVLTFLMIGPSVSYSYYLVNSVLIAVVLIADGLEPVLIGGLLRWAVRGALVLSLVPFGWPYDDSGMSLTVQLAGPSWLLVFVLALWRGGSIALGQMGLERRKA